MMQNDALVLAWKRNLERAAARPLPPNVPKLFSDAAAAHPERVVIRMFEDNQQLTYGELDSLSSCLAVQLRAAGIESGTQFAVMLPNCLQWHITWLACLKLGVAVVPVNPTYTLRELEYVIDDARVGGLVAGTDRIEVAMQLVKRFPSLQSLVWVAAPRLGDPCSWQALMNSCGAASSHLEPDCNAGLDTPANIQYTSGTTGLPKGCVLTHGYWLNLAQAAQLAHRGDGGQAAPLRRFFTAQPFFYMDPFWQLVMTAMSSGTLYAARKISAGKFLGWLQEHQIEWAQLPELALKAIDSVAGKRMALRQVFTFGWSADSRRAFEDRFGVPAVESFGMTEIGLGLTMPQGYPSLTKPTSVGVAALRRDARIVDPGGKPVGPGESGELQIRGAHLFKGYFNKPDATASAFEGDWFKTGDAFVMDADGFYRIVGRFKDMIRRSNENIAAREVEAVVRELPQVFDCAAVPVPDPVRGEEVKIVVQLRPELLRAGLSSTDVLPLETLFAHCRSDLAPFKVPRYVQFVEEFPRTSSNKIIKHQLGLAAKDPKAGSYDRIEGIWHAASTA